MCRDDPMVPVPYRVAARRPETGDVVTLDLVPAAAPIPDPEPGQFTMLYAFGVGEVPISVSGLPGDEGVLRHTIRAVGATTAALSGTEVGHHVGVRGPFGRGWDLDATDGADVVVVAGGLGLAPLRPVVRHLAAGPTGRELAVLVGARSPDAVAFADELAGLDRRGDVQSAVIVDAASPAWTGPVGVVTDLLAHVQVDVARAVALVCGPEPMMRFAARALEAMGVGPERIQVSLERSMHCGLGRCGHCLLGPRFVCRDGPVFRWSDAAPLLGVRGR